MFIFDNDIGLHLLCTFQSCVASSSKRKAADLHHQPFRPLPCIHLHTTFSQTLKCLAQGHNDIYATVIPSETIMLNVFCFFCL